MTGAFANDQGSPVAQGGMAQTVHATIRRLSLMNLRVVSGISVSGLAA